MADPDRTYAGDETTGFQSPARDHIQPVVDLAELLQLRRPGMYPVRVQGQGLASRGVMDGDVLITNAAAELRPGRICVAFAADDVVLAVVERGVGGWRLRTGSARTLAVEGDVEIWAVVEALVRTGL